MWTTFFRVGNNNNIKNYTSHFVLVIVLILSLARTENYKQQTYHEFGSIQGSTQPFFVQKGFFHSKNTPGGLASAFIIQYKKSFFAFYGYSKPGEVNDRVWEYCPLIKQYRLLSGREVNNQQATESNICSRSESTGIIEPNQGTVFIFGGTQFLKSQEGEDVLVRSNDMWIYNISSNQYKVLRTNFYNSPEDNNTEMMLFLNNLEIFIFQICIFLRLQASCGIGNKEILIKKKNMNLF